MRRASSPVLCCATYLSPFPHFMCLLRSAQSTHPTTWCPCRHFGIYVLAFSIGTWANMKVLQVSNVETVIVFRGDTCFCPPPLLAHAPSLPGSVTLCWCTFVACAPLVICMFDFQFHRRALPNRRSVGAMLLISLGAICYVLTDRRQPPHCQTLSPPPLTPTSCTCHHHHYHQTLPTPRCSV